MPPKKTLDFAASYSVGWIAALPIERAAAIVMLDERHDQPQDFVKNESDQNSYTWGRIGKHNVVIASLPAGEYGTVSAADTASGLRSSLPDIRIGLLVGIGAGVPGKRDILLGDVVVSNPDGTNGGVVQYDLYKAKTDSGLHVDERKGFLSSPPRALRSALAALQAEHEVDGSRIEEFLGDIQRNERMSVAYGYPGHEKDLLRQLSNADQPRAYSKIHYGTIASGNRLIEDAQERDLIVKWLEQENVKPICFEMEAAGLMNSFPCVVIRGICDYADEHKNDVWQKYSAATAAAFAKEFLGYIDAGEVALSRKIEDILSSG